MNTIGSLLVLPTGDLYLAGWQLGTMPVPFTLVLMKGSCLGVGGGEEPWSHDQILHAHRNWREWQDSPPPETPEMGDLPEWVHDFYETRQLTDKGEPDYEGEG